MHLTYYVIVSALGFVALAGVGLVALVAVFAWVVPDLDEAPRGHVNEEYIDTLTKRLRKK